MMDWKFFQNVLYPSSPVFPNTRSMVSVELPDAGRPMGTVYLGEQGSGKSTEGARDLVEYAERHPTHPIVVFDPSGNITNDILSIVERRPPEVREALMRRIVYDELAHPRLTKSMPEFHVSYDIPMSKQHARVVDNFAKLEPELMTETPIMGGLSIQIAPELFKVLTAITPNYSVDPFETWQITEAKRLLVSKPLLRQALAKVSGRVGSADFFFKENFLELGDSERVKRIHALLSVLDRIEVDEIRARVGATEPAYTFKEIIERGLILIVNGQNLIGQSKTKQYLFVQLHSMLMAEINKRTPADPADKPVIYFLDELYELTGIPGMASELSRLSPIYRSRKLQFSVVLQNLSQLTEELRPHIWSLGNFVCFNLLDFNDAYMVAQQLFPYIPEAVKLPARTDNAQPITEPDRGQFLQITNYLRNMEPRECVFRRQLSEARKDKHTIWVKKTKEVLKDVSFERLKEIREELMEKRAKETKELLRQINQRKLGPSQSSGRKTIS